MAPTPLTQTFALATLTTTEAAAVLTAGCMPCELAQEQGIGQYATPLPGMMMDAAPSDVTWSGVIGMEDKMTGDGRYIDGSALRWENLPIPLRWVREDTGGHQNAVVVGRILTLTRRPGGQIWATGDIDMGSEDGCEYARLMDGGLCNGVSMDLDSVSFEIRVAKELLVREEQIDAADDAHEVVPGPVDASGRVTVIAMGADDEVMVTTDARIRAVTGVAVPAFAEAMIYLDQPLAAPDSLVASVTGSTGLPVADRGAAWDGAAAAGRVFDHFTDSAGKVDTAGVAKAFLYRDPNADPATKGAYKLGFADVIGGELQVVPKGVAATAGGRGVDSTSGISSDEKTQIKAKICTLYGKVRAKYSDWPLCPFDGSKNAAQPTLFDTPAQELTSLTERINAGINGRLVASGFPVAPPSAWFNKPGFRELTPHTVTPQGEVMGHLAGFGTCHTGFPGRCVTPPHSNSDYAYFLTGAILTAEGAEIPVGQLTIDTHHAGDTLSAAATMAHYDHTGTAIADVTVGEDEYGIWYHGAIRPGITPEQVRTLRASPVSGDWREMRGNLELVAALGVNVQGFPVPRPHGLVASGRMVSLVAAGMLAPDTLPVPQGVFSDDDLAYLKRLADRERRQEEAETLGVQTEAEALAAKVTALGFARRVKAAASTVIESTEGVV